MVNLGRHAQTDWQVNLHFCLEDLLDVVFFKTSLQEKLSNCLRSCLMGGWQPCPVLFHSFSKI